MADAAELDVDPHVLGPERSTLDLQRAERRVGRKRADGTSGSGFRSRSGESFCSHATHGRDADGPEGGPLSPPQPYASIRGSASRDPRVPDLAPRKSHPG